MNKWILTEGKVFKTFNSGPQSPRPNTLDILAKKIAEAKKVLL